MVDEIQSGDVAQVNDVAPPQVQDTSTSEAPAESVQQIQQEKMIPESQVSKIAAREARNAYEKGQREAQAKYEQERMSQNQPAPSVGGMQPYTPEQMQQMIRDQAHIMAQQSVLEKIASDFESKIETAIKADPEFQDKYEALRMTEHPKTILWANSLENTTDVIKDMADHPAKYANILMLADRGLDTLAKQELQKLSASIKANQAAQNAPVANAPLSQIKTSNIGLDNGATSVSDLMKQDWLRG